MKKKLLTILAAVLIATINMHAQAMLEGAWAEPDSIVNLTEEGTLDWVHVGLNSVDYDLGEENRKVGGDLITIEAIANAPDPEGGEDFPYWVYGEDVAIGFNWTDGAPTASATEAYSGWNVPAETNGFRFTAPADETEKTLTLYLGGWEVWADVLVSLSDGSAAEIQNIEHDSQGDLIWAKYVVNYKAGSAGQTLTVDYVITRQHDIQWGGWGNVMFTAATLSGEGATDVNELDGKIPSDYELGQNYPNPFNPSTKINFSIPKQNHVSIKVFDILGNEVTTLVDQDMSPGAYEVDFNASIDGNNLTSGIYFYQIIAGEFSSIKKMMLLK